MRIGPAIRSALVVAQLDVQRLGQLARARAELALGLQPAAAAHQLEPAVGSSARISTAAPTSSGSHTALIIAWMP